jgi:hypothetical protein
MGEFLMGLPKTDGFDGLFPKLTSLRAYRKVLNKTRQYPSVVSQDLCTFMQSFIATFPEATFRPMAGFSPQSPEEIAATHSRNCAACAARRRANQSMEDGTVKQTALFEPARRQKTIRTQRHACDTQNLRAAKEILREVEKQGVRLVTWARAAIERIEGGEV